MIKRKLTSRDVAKEAGVSQSLVSLILNNTPGKKIKTETREHVFKVAKTMGYKVNINARSMKSSNASAVGLLSSWDANSFVFPPVINGVKSVCTEKDLGVVICSGNRNSYGSYDFIDYYLQNRIDGLIYVSYVGVKNDGIIDELTRAGIPFACIIGARDLPGVSCVDVNFFESGYMAVKHLIENGYSRIGYLMEDREDILNYARRERLEGSNRAACEHDIELHLVENFIGITEETNYMQAAYDVLDDGRYDAIISESYKSFIILKAAARRNMNVPRDLGVISLDNDQYAPYLYPSLTTVDEPLFDIAAEATNILLDKIHGTEGCKKLEISPRLTIRESTKKA